MDYAGPAPSAPDEPEPAERDNLRDALEEALRATGFPEIVDAQKQLRQRRPSYAPFLVALAISFGLLLVELMPVAAAVVAAVVGVYGVGLAIESIGGRRAAAAFLGFLLLAWLVTGVVQLVRGEYESVGVTHALPAGLAVLLFYGFALIRGLSGAVRSIPLLFGVVLLVLFIPLFTQELWATMADLDAWHAAALGLLAMLPVFVGVRHQVCNSLPAAFIASAERLEESDKKAGRRAARELTKTISGRRLTPGVTSVAPALESTLPGSLIRRWALSAAFVWEEPLTRAFSAPAPRTYAAMAAKQVRRSFGRRISLLLLVFVTVFTAVISLYIYTLAAVAINAEAAAEWSGQVSIPQHELGPLTVPGGPYISVSLFLGVVATAIFLALALAEERYSAVLADAIIHSGIERCLLFSIPYYFSKAPPNDWFGRADKLAGRSGSEHGLNVGASREPGEPEPPKGGGGKSVWYTWQAQATGPVTIDTAGSSFDTVLTAYVGSSVDALTLVASNDDARQVHGLASNRTSRVAFDATAGTVYWIAVDGYRYPDGDVAEGEITLNYTCVPPQNDAFDRPIRLAEKTGWVEATNLNATHEAGERAHALAAGGRSVWFAWEAPEDAPVVIDTAGSEFDAVVAVYTGARLDDLDEVAVTDAASTRARFDAEAGVTYRIVVDGHDPDEDGASAGVISLAWWSGIPSNDGFAYPERLRGSSGVVVGANLNATGDQGERRHAGAGGGKSVWYIWRAEANGRASFDTTGSTFDTVLAVYAGNALESLDDVAANDDAAAGVTTSRVEFEARAGTEYRIAVDGYADQTAEVADGWFVMAWDSPPVNDQFDSAKTLSGPVGDVIGTNVAATKEPDEPDHAGNIGGQSVWYTWTSAADGPVVITSERSSFDTLLAVYTGDSLEDLDVVASNDDEAFGLGSRVEFQAKRGTEYRIAVDGYGDSEGKIASGAIILRWAQSPPA